MAKLQEWIIKEGERRGSLQQVVTELVIPSSHKTLFATSFPYVSF